MGAFTREQAESKMCCPACGSEVTVASWETIGDMPCSKCKHLFWFVRQPIDNMMVLTFLPGLMLASESLMRIDEVCSAIGDSPRVVLDVSHLRIMPSIFLGMLVALQRRTTAGGAVLKICAAEPGPRDVFRTTKLDKFFDVYTDLYRAMDSF